MPFTTNPLIGLRPRGTKRIVTKYTNDYFEGVPSDLATGGSVNITPSNNANKAIVFMFHQTTTAWATAEVNLITREITLLTESGTFTTTTGAQACPVIWNSGNSTWYFLNKTATAGDWGLYPITRSGDTMTAGARIALNASFAHANRGNQVMVQAAGKIYVLEMLNASPVMKAYDIGGASWGAALTCPSFPTSIIAARAVFFKAGDDLFLLATDGTLQTTKLFKYVIGTDTWTTHAVFPYDSGNGVVLADPDDASDCIISFAGNAKSYRVTLSTGAFTYIGKNQGGNSVRGFLWTGTTYNQGPTPFLLDISAQQCLVPVAPSSGNGGITQLGHLSDWYAGDVNYTGSGSLEGLVCPIVASNTIRNDEDIRYDIIIDGGTPTNVSAGGADLAIERQQMRLPFTTSLKIRQTTFGTTEVTLPHSILYYERT